MSELVMPVSQRSCVLYVCWTADIRQERKQWESEIKVFKGENQLGFKYKKHSVADLSGT